VGSDVVGKEYGKNNISENIIFDRGNFENCTGEYAIYKREFINCIFSNFSFDDVELIECKFINCQFVGGTEFYFKHKNCTFTNCNLSHVIKYRCSCRKDVTVTLHEIDSCDPMNVKNDIHDLICCYCERKMIHALRMPEHKITLMHEHEEMIEYLKDVHCDIDDLDALTGKERTAKEISSQSKLDDVIAYLEKLNIVNE
jgi:hypothetical protein